MRSKRARLFGGNTRSRLVLTLGLAVVLPALTLIYVNYRHVKSIQRDKKIEALIHRDFQYVLSITEKRLRQKAVAFIDDARNSYPSAADGEVDKRQKLNALLAANPLFSHAFFYDAALGDKALIVQSQTCMTDKEHERLVKNYTDWFGMEGPDIIKSINRKTKRLTWYSYVGDSSNGPAFNTTALFTLPGSSPDKVVFGGIGFDANQLKQIFFPAVIDEVLSKKLTDKQDASVAEMLHELTPAELEAGGPADERLAMNVYYADTGMGEDDRPFMTSSTWGLGEPEVAHNLDDPFKGLALGIKFQGTTAEAIGRRWVTQSFMILGVLSVLMIGGLVLTYRSVNKQVALARLKSDFVSNVSHELRTPLALIRLYAETLELGRITTNEKKNEYYSIIRKESERLTALINNILDFSRIEAGRKEYDFKETDIAELVRNTLDSYRFQIEQQGFALEEQIEPNIPKVRVDREAIARALVNLVNNALKYSDHEKFLGVKLYREQSVLKLEVIDRGIGIERNEQSRIFEKFYRTCDPLVHNTKGSGLGLSLVRHITEAHGGDVEVESTPGRGSKFTLKLPIAGAMQRGTTGAA